MDLNHWSPTRKKEEFQWPGFEATIFQLPQSVPIFVPIFCSKYRCSKFCPAQVQLRRRPAGNGWSQRLFCGLFPGLWMTFGHFKDSAATAPLQYHWKTACQASRQASRQAGQRHSQERQELEHRISLVQQTPQLTTEPGWSGGSSREIPVTPEGATWRAPPQRLPRSKAKCEGLKLYVIINHINMYKYMYIQYLYIYKRV